MAGPTATIYLTVKGLPRPIEFHDCPELADAIAAVLCGWEVRRLSWSGEEPLVRFRRHRRGYFWDAPWRVGSAGERRSASKTAIEAVCDFHYEFVGWYEREKPDHFCLHCASALIGGRLVLFPSTHKAGKSLLCAQLALDGARIFGDDVVGIDPQAGHGIALGMLPRIRLPVPRRNVGEALRAFLAERRGPSDEECQYVDLREDEIAGFGEAAPIGAIVILKRRDSGPAALEPIDAGAALKAMIAQNFALKKPPLSIFEELRRITLACRSPRLCYADLAEASGVLRRAFGAEAAAERSPAPCGS